ncbi:MAG: hypothetical protein A2Z18_11345 [Armatimonadetes bacterium RBG_16_58_9]|nr:MAG: hypothetical protein A2Z18_11345 [Armatimonadetes bacterium RBG_16_58_9]
MASLKVEFATVRELEKKSFRVFAYGGGALLLGLVFTVTGLVIIGVPVLVVSALVLLGGIAWVSMLAKEDSKPMFCPYCSSKNDVYLSRKSFDCDICSRPVVVSETGEPLMAEAIDTEARYDR